MHPLGNIIIILMTSYSAVSGNTILGMFAVLSGGEVPASLGRSLLCGKRCNENTNCAGFYIGPEGACQLFEHGQATVTLSAGGTFYGKVCQSSIDLHGAQFTVSCICLYHCALLNSSTWW